MSTKKNFRIRWDNIAALALFSGSMIALAAALFYGYNL